MLLGPKEKDERKSTMIKVLYVPKLAANLFSARAAAMKEKVVQFGHTLCWIKDSQGNVVARGRLLGNMYRLNCGVERKEKQVSVAERSSDKLNLWHQRPSKDGSFERWPNEDDGFKRDSNRYQYA